MKPDDAAGRAERVRLLNPVPPDPRIAQGRCGAPWEPRKQGDLTAQGAAGNWRRAGEQITPPASRGLDPFLGQRRPIASAWRSRTPVWHGGVLFWWRDL